MVAVPFVYFTLLFLWHFYKQHKKIDIASFILIIYASSAFFSILVEKYGLSYYPYYKISLLATFAYCSLLTISVLPFLRNSNLTICNIRPIPNGNLLKYASICVFLYFIVYLYMSANDVYNVLTGDIGELRAAHYTENISSGWLAKMNPIARIPFIIFNLITGSPWILQFLGFYTVIIQKLPMRYGAFFIFASLIGVVNNLSEAGRSDMVYWLIGITACYIFYKPFIDRQNITIVKRFKTLGYLLIAGGLFLVGLITFSRYGERDSGASGGFILYFGQAFNHFAYFFDTFECPYPTLEILFPFTYHILGVAQGGVVSIQQMLTLKTGIFTGLFYTYIGQIAITSNFYVASLFCILYSAISLSICRHRKFVSLKSSYLYMLMASVMFMGLFSHYYGFMNKTASSIIWFLTISLFSNYSKSANYRNKSCY